MAVDCCLGVLQMGSPTLTGKSFVTQVTPEPGDCSTQSATRVARDSVKSVGSRLYSVWIT